MTLDEKHEQCRELLGRAHFKVADPERALWSSAKISAEEKPKDLLAKLNGALQRFVADVRSRTRSTGGRWSEDVADPHEFPGGETLPVRLNALDKGDGRHYSRDGTKHVYKIHLPVVYVRELLRRAVAIAREHDLLDGRSGAEESTERNL